MALKIAVGTRLGPYEIVDWLGAGGMGEVYRARDPRLARDVALKLITPSLASDPGRLNRFELEARAAGQLNHPNILAVYDVGSHGGAPYIVSELLEGESLRQRLQQGALPVRKAMEYARQTAEGLAAAHDRQIVHRDVKPDNLFVTTDDRIKILDFGIAKLTQAAEASIERQGSQTETADGMIVGTTAYMSPEQVRGETVDARSDIFSLGAILYEALTGHAAFARPTPAETLAAVLKDDPPSLLSTTNSPALARIVERCLEKAREARFQSARDLAFGLDSLSDRSDTALSTSRLSRPGWLAHRSVPWTLAGLLTFGLAVAVMALWSWQATPEISEPMHVRFDLGSQALLNPESFRFGDSAALSPDGRSVAYVAQPGAQGTPQLYLRRFHQLQAQPLPWTDLPHAPFFSPDGQWIGFFARGQLKKVAVTGGAAVTLADAPNQRGGSWSEDGTIVFSPDRTPGTRLLRVSSNGEGLAPVTSLADGEVLQVWPQVLPGGREVLYTASNIPGTFNDANLVVQVLSSGERKVVQRGGYHGRYLATGRNTGHLVYIHDGGLIAVAFDPGRLETIGDPVRVVEGIASNPTTGGAQFSISATGILLYQAGQTASPGSPIHWLDREGRSPPLRATPANWFNLAFAPDGTRLAIEIRDGPVNIHMYDLANDRINRLTSDPIRAQKPVWAPQGRHIAFASPRGDGTTMNLWLQSVEIGATAQRLTESKSSQSPGSWHPSGSFLAFEEENRETGFDLMILPVEGSDAAGWRPGKPEVFLNSVALEREPMFSPDGRWLAYETWASGPSEVYVRRFPGPGAPVKISADSGAKPTWSRTRSELYYGRVNGEIMVVPYAVNGDSFQPGTPRLWSEGRYVPRGPSRMFDLHPDGQRFAIAPLPADAATQPDDIVMFQNFFDELRRLVPTGRR